MNAICRKTRVPAWLRSAPDSMNAYVRRSGRSAGLQWTNVLWSVWVFTTPIFDPHAGWPFVWSLLVGYPIFLLLFALVHVRPYRETGCYVAALTLLAVASMPFNSAAWSYGVFACVYVPYSPRNTIATYAFGLALVEGALVLAAVWLNWPWMIIAIAVGVCTSA